jgi:predicted flap endonuclease-1-like 5' DNA nuclease
MRIDYPLYVVAIICFLAAILTYTQQLADPIQLYLYVLAVLGIVFLGLGYVSRPKSRTFSSLATPASQQFKSPLQSKTEPELRSATTTTALTKVRGIGSKRSKQLRSIGITSVESLVKHTSKELAEKAGVSEKITTKWLQNARKLSESNPTVS